MGKRKQGTTRYTIRHTCDLTFSVSLDVMSLTSSLLDQAYHKLARWCSFEFRQMGRDASLEVDSTMQEAVRRLRQRPELLKYVYERNKQWNIDLHSPSFF